LLRNANRMANSKNLKVKRIKFCGYSKEVQLNTGEVLSVSTSTCVDENSIIEENDNQKFVRCYNGLVPLSQAFKKKERLAIGGLSIDIIVKEITTAKEVTSYESLSNFHYKGRRLFGRSSILVATSNTPYLPHVLGYIELTTPFYVNKPRANLFNAPFQHNGISWDKWDKEATKKYINIICRIARCVVYPEFRGVGLGQILVKHATSYAKQRWQISNYKPLFLEISADMLKYVPFPQKVGMHYIGDTEGNLSRLKKDMEYLLTNHKRVENGEIVSEQQMGIVMQQKSRLKKALEIMAENNLTIGDFLKRLEKATKLLQLQDLKVFGSLISLPKPTYILGLDKVSEQFIAARTQGLKITEQSLIEKLKCTPLQKEICIKNLSIKYNSKKRISHNTIAIQNAFNLSEIKEEPPIIKELSITINPSEIILITGSSGAGKTTLINYLSTRKKLKKVFVSGVSDFPSNYKIATFCEITSKKPLIELFGQGNLKFGLEIMGLVGLSDAYVYLKSYDELSKGQQFRAQLAQAILTGANTLIIDEYCSNLDPVSANVVTYRLRKLVKRFNLTLIVGCAHCESFIESLKPDKVIRLSTGWDFGIIPGITYTKSLLKR
jgi:ABC-type dipeptide/oligopeptide/nickel transport system ATPase subunit/GNAT superfamily N-acetyltransferase